MNDIDTPGRVIDLHSVNAVFPVNVSEGRRLDYCITCNDPLA